MNANVPHGVPMWLRVLSVVVPGDIRRDFTWNVLADRRESEARGASSLRRNFALLRAILEGFAQYAPLRPVVAATSPKPHIAARAALAGWIAWRLAGPALLVGHLMGSTLLVVLGALALAAAFGCLVTVASTARSPLSARESRLVAGILGGTLATLLLIVAMGLATIGLLALASVFSSGLLMGLAVKSLVLVATASLAAVGGSGWVPAEFDPKRLVENEDVRRQPVEEPAAEEALA